MDSVLTFLKNCLANQPDALYESVLRTVNEAGVESFEDLNYLDPEKDFLGILKPIQARKLKAEIDEAFSSEINTTKPEESNIYQLESPLLESPLENFLQVISRNSVFEIPYNKIPKSAISKLEKGECPTPAERRQIVRIVVAELFETVPAVAELFETVPALRKSQLEPIVKEIVGNYSRSFSDCIGGSIIGGGIPACYVS
ncbi:hypothetical protein AVEN_38527-1 [Araneus ventricosus]|uniref:Uncharacterized protein n=1 Tax=Araneus ventricosus TaxID=182803 RepID=A0A4Y2MIK0_ARAVE|nr:hypothetical protein AVEN_38527-1 [Araneus ventricosus]